MVCGYINFFTSKATNWAIMNKSVARKRYTKNMKKEHTMFSISVVGFIIIIEVPFIGASPDGYVNCQCHGAGLLEIKCP